MRGCRPFLSTGTGNRSRTCRRTEGTRVEGTRFDGESCCREQIRDFIRPVAVARQPHRTTWGEFSPV